MHDFFSPCNVFFFGTLNVREFFSSVRVLEFFFGTSVLAGYFLQNLHPPLKVKWVTPNNGLFADKN